MTRIAKKILVFVWVGLAGVISGLTVSSGAALAASESWSIVVSPNPAGATDTYLQGVSCLSATFCTAVGEWNNGSTEQSLVEVWNGSAWSITPSPNPAGATYTELNAVSCVSSTDCTAVGTSNGATLIEVWDGSAWTIAPNPNPGSSASLVGVSCVTSSYCTAVGYWNSSNAERLLAEVWDGTAWSIAPAPNPAGSLDSTLSGVTCVSATRCTAVGTWRKSRKAGGVSLAEVWDGSAWSIAPAPNPAGSTETELWGVSCVSATSCTTVGDWYNAGMEQPLVEDWDGTAWSGDLAPNPAGSIGTELRGVSCVSTTNCTAVGVWETSAEVQQSVVEVWDGTAWSIAPTPDAYRGADVSLSVVSCVSATNCTAAGGKTGAPGGGDLSLIESSGPSVSPAVVSSDSDAFTQGVADSFVVKASGGPTPSLSVSGTLPSGVSFVDNGDGTGVVSGTATQSGVFPLTFTASNGVSPDGTQSFTLTVNPPVTTWTDQSGAASPGGLVAASMAYDPAASQLVLFGGSPSSGTEVNGTWLWSGSTWSKVSPVASPPARSNAAMAYDPTTSQLVLFGGVAAGGVYLGDTWTWNGSNWTQLSPTTSPPPRDNASMAYDPAAGQLLLFGGTGSSTSVGDDTWTWDGSAWTQLSPAASPPARSRASLAWDPATSQLVLFGGNPTGGGQALGDTWTWNGSTWGQLSPAASPPARGYAAFGYDPPAAQPVLFGGNNGGPLDDTWDWSGSTWTRLSPVASPPGRYRAASAYDAATSQLVVFGGSGSSGSLAETWTYGPVPAVASTAPSIDTTTPGDRQVAVRFEPPSNNGGAPVTSYTVTAADQTTQANGGQTATGSSSPIIVAGLTNGDSYTVTVTPTNSAGTGPASTPSNAVVPAVPVTISSVTPNQLAQGSSKATVAINGSGYFAPLNVTISGGGVTPTLVSVTPSTVTLTVTMSQSAVLGDRDVAVSDPNGTVTCTGCLTVSSAPSLTGVSPSQLAAGAKGTLTLTGSGFEPGATIKITGPSTGVKTASSSITFTPTTIAATVKATASSPPGAYTVTVINPDHSKAACTDCLTVIAAPTLTAINPNSAARGTTTSVTLTGSGFASGTTVKGPSGVIFTGITVVNSTTITATMKVSGAAPTGSNLPVTVTNNEAGGYGKVIADLLTVT